MSQTAFTFGARGNVTHLTGSADALNNYFPGIVVIDSGVADQTTLPTPISGPDTGLPAGRAEGDDANMLLVLSTTAFAHKITVPTGKFINGSTGAFTTATFAAKVGASILLVAMSGFWFVLAANNVTLA